MNDLEDIFTQEPGAGPVRDVVIPFLVLSLIIFLVAFVVLNVAA